MNKPPQILTFCFLFLSFTLYSQKAKDSYSSGLAIVESEVRVDSSILRSGKWFRIAVTADGIYRIDYSRLKQIGLTYPSNPKIYGNNFGQLSYSNNAPKPDDLKELSIYITGSDSLLNEGEYLLFFGRGTSKWIYSDSTGEYNYLRHNYSDTAFYFITSGSTPGKKIIIAKDTSQTANYNSNKSDALFIHEQENENLIKSGREWFQPISSTVGIRINPGFTDLLVSEKVNCSFRVAARAAGPTLFGLYEGESLKKSIQVQGVDLFNYIGTYAQINSGTGSIIAGSPSPVYEIRFNSNGEPGAKGWIDWVKLQGRRSNSFTGPAAQYNDSRSVSKGRLTRFAIKCLINDTRVWDISDPLNIKEMPLTRTADSISFKAATNSLKTFFAFTPGNALIPSIKPAAIHNQDLHSSEPVDMIILTHPLFRTYAEMLANIHFINSGLTSLIVTPEQVYNEFSGGIPDIAAIRNFVRMKYQIQKRSVHPLKYLLLFGDGSYENKTLPPNNPNFIPTFQSQNSNVIVSSFTSDDFYGLLSDGDGEAEENGEKILKDTLDIGIGRLPVSDTIQAGIIISKIKKYLDPANMGDWKNVICITADDEDANTHMSDAESLAALLKDNAPSFNVEKIYLDAFRQTTSVTGQSYPDVTKAINNRINAGCLIFNYIGHGNEIGLAAERIIKMEDINSWKNSAKLPLFITATCEFSRFDDIETNIITKEMTEKTSAGETVLLKKDGGGIALMSTTRVVYSAPNYYLNRNIFNFAFDSDKYGNTMRLGDIIRMAKNNSGSGQNKRNFTLLGDPALKLAYPWHGKVITDSINNVSVFNKIDSLKALSLITIAGHIEDQNGNLSNTFNGVVSPIVFDKVSKIKTLANDGGQIMEFNLMNNILFSGKTIVNDGKFRFTFIVPRDIDYSFGPGKISYYANDNLKDMNGSFTKIFVGGFSKISLSDTDGPDIKLFMNDTLFRNGGITDNNPKLLAIIEDKGGINTTGAGIGHDLTGFLDNDPNKSFVLNNYFENDFNNYMRGRIIYDLSGLIKGSHSITVKAWDNFNNSSEKSILFLVETDGKIILKNLMNYPNPFFSETRIIAEHNRPDAEFDVTINIFSLNGRLIKIIRTQVPSTGFVLPPVIWDGNDDGGKRVGKGLYPYTVIVKTGNGETARASGRMIIL